MEEVREGACEEENLFFRRKHFNPLSGLGSLVRDMETQDKIDTRAPVIEHDARSERVLAYTMGVVTYHITRVAFLGTAAYVLANKIF